MRSINGVEAAGVIFFIELLRNKKSRPYAISCLIMVPLIVIGCAFVSEFAHSINQFDLIFGLYLTLSLIVLFILIGKAFAVYYKDKYKVSNKSSIKKFWVLPLKRTLIMFFCVFLPSFGILYACLIHAYCSNQISKENFIFLSITLLGFGIMLFMISNSVYKSSLEKLQQDK